MRRWHVVTTKHTQLYTAARGLREQGYLVYIAKKHSPLRPPEMRRKLFAVTTPRFAGYLFVQFDAERGEQGPISNTRGIAGLVPPHPQDPVEIDDKIIDELRQAEDTELANIERERIDKTSSVRHGQTVRINRGPFKDMHGQVAGNAHGMLTLLIGSRVAKIAEYDVTPVLETQGKP